MKKVFCGTCRYRKFWEAAMGCCGYKCKKKFTHHTSNMKTYTMLIDCEEVNKNNDCKDYELDLLKRAKRFQLKLWNIIIGKKEKVDVPVEDRFEIMDL